jgi:hypothetical protein
MKHSVAIVNDLATASSSHSPELSEVADSGEATFSGAQPSGFLNFY